MKFWKLSTGCGLSAFHLMRLTYHSLHELPEKIFLDSLLLETPSNAYISVTYWAKQIIHSTTIVQTAPNSGSNYFCYKKIFSLVLFGLVDADYTFPVVDIGEYGKNSDGGVFPSSVLGKAMKGNKFDLPPDKQLPGSLEILPYVTIINKIGCVIWLDTFSNIF